MNSPLAGRRIVVTRPTEQVDKLAGQIEARGGIAVRFPVLAIFDADDSRPLLAAAYAGIWLASAMMTNGAANIRAVIFQAPIYLKTVLAALEANSSVFWWTAAWLLIMGLFAGRRFLYVRVPALLRDFFASVQSFSQRHKKS